GAARGAHPGAEPGAGPRRGTTRRARALMRAWKAVVLLNLALLVGAGWGYAFGGGRAARVRGGSPDVGWRATPPGEMKECMPAMTMGFRVASPKIQEAVSVGDAVRFTVRGVPPNVAVIAIQKITL